MTNLAPKKINGSFTTSFTDSKFNRIMRKSPHSSTSPLANLCCILNNRDSNQGRLSNEFLSKWKLYFKKHSLCMTLYVPQVMAAAVNKGVPGSGNRERCKAKGTLLQCCTWLSTVLKFYSLSTFFGLDDLQALLPTQIILWLNYSNNVPVYTSVHCVYTLIDTVSILLYT